MTRELYQKSDFVRANGNVYEVCNGIDLCEICLYVYIYIYISCVYLATARIALNERRVCEKFKMWQR